MKQQVGIAMAAWPVVLAMNVEDYKGAWKIRKTIGDLRGAVESVWASPEQALVVVHGTADAWALRRRIWRKMNRRAFVVRDGSAPYSYQRQGPTAAPYYDSSSQANGWGDAAPYYSQPPPPHAYYSQPVRSYPYAAGGYGAGWADPDTYGYYAAHSTVPTCSIL